MEPLIKNHFCTYFDINYLTRGLALYNSLINKSINSELWILCMDTQCHQVLMKMNLPNLHLITLNEFELYDREVVLTKDTRSRIEYYFTCTPALMRYIFHKQNDIVLLTYIDSDLFFFNDPTDLLQTLAEYSISITPHRFPEKIQYLEQLYGTFNVGWITIRRDDIGILCIELWRTQCITWCYDRSEEGLFGDQGYLNQWPYIFSNLKIIDHKGINLALYNIANYKLNLHNDILYVDDDLLVCFHFFGLKNYLDLFFYFPVDKYLSIANDLLLDKIYEPYLNSLSIINAELSNYSKHIVKSNKIRVHNFEVVKNQRYNFTNYVNNAFKIIRLIMIAAIKRRFLIYFKRRIRLRFLLNRSNNY